MMLALTQAQGIILVVGGGIFVLIAGGVLVLRGRRAAARPDIPVAMRPGPSDADLETPLLNKLQGWGVLLVVFFVIWVPMTWLFEPDRNLSQEQALLTDAIHRGAADVQLFTEENQGGVGCDGLRRTVDRSPEDLQPERHLRDDRAGTRHHALVEHPVRRRAR
jgi:hypothetical protein